MYQVSQCLLIGSRRQGMSSGHLGKAVETFISHNKSSRSIPDETVLSPDSCLRQGCHFHSHARPAQQVADLGRTQMAAGKQSCKQQRECSSDHREVTEETTWAGLALPQEQSLASSHVHSDRKGVLSRAQLPTSV